MARFVTGNTFGTTDTVTSTTLNNAVNNAAISTDSVDGSTIEINSNALRIKDSGVTKAKIENVANMKVLGNTSGSATAPQEVAVLDEDNMSTNSATSLVTQQSIKAFVDNLIGTADKSSASGLVTEGDQGSLTLGGGLIIKFGTVNKNTTAGVDVTFQDSSGSASAFPNAIYGINVTPQENSDAASETASVISPTVSGFTLAGYHGVSNSAIGRCFFIAIGY
jgi:hypothetical protein